MDENKKPLLKGYTLYDWTKSICLIIILGLFCYKIGVSDINFDFSKFDFTDLLSLILALFAIGLSVAFYFKSTDSSSLFYDNTYKFTKDTSEMLGHIEALFGERLKHIDDFNTNIFEKLINLKTTGETVKVTENELYTKKVEKEKLIQELLDKTNIDQSEKDRIKKELEDKDTKISEMEIELNELKDNSTMYMLLSQKQNLTPKSADAIRKFARNLINEGIEIDDYVKVNQSFIDYFDKRLFRLGIFHQQGIAVDKSLTDEGYRLVRMAYFGY